MLKTVILLAVAIVVVVTACVPFRAEPVPPIAIVRDGQVVEILYGRCPGESVSTVRVQRIDHSAGGIVTGPVLWEIQSSAGTEVERIRVGGHIPGFRTIVPLDQQLPTKVPIVVDIQSSRFENSMTVSDVSDAKAGRAYSDGHNYTFAEFEQVSRC